MMMSGITRDASLEYREDTDVPDPLSLTKRDNRPSLTSAPTATFDTTTPIASPSAGQMMSPSSAAVILRRLESACLPLLYSLCPEEAAAVFEDNSEEALSVTAGGNRTRELARKLGRAVRAALLVQTTPAAAPVCNNSPALIRHHSSLRTNSNSSQSPNVRTSAGPRATDVFDAIPEVNGADQSLVEQSPRNAAVEDAAKELMENDELPPPLHVEFSNHTPKASAPDSAPLPTNHLDSLEALVAALSDAISSHRHLQARRQSSVLVRAFDFCPGTPASSHSTPIAAAAHEMNTRRVSMASGVLRPQRRTTAVLISPRAVTNVSFGLSPRAVGNVSFGVLPLRRDMTHRGSVAFEAAAHGMSPAARARLRSDSVWSVTNVPPAQMTSAAIFGDEDFDGTSTINQYVLLQSIGRGAQGEVMLAMDNNTNEFRAIKVVSRPENAEPSPENADSPEGPSRTVVASVKSRLQHARSRIGQLQREIAAMKRCRHRNIVSLYEVIDDPAVHCLYLVMQYVEHGSLVTMSGNGTPDHVISPYKLAGYARQICAGLQYLHNHGIVHRDIKPDNILLGRDDVVYLSDFGVADVFENFGGAADVSGTRGTTMFFAPELLDTENGEATDGKAVDVWALGLTFYVLLYGQFPWGRVSSYQQCFDCIQSAPIDCPAITADDVKVDPEWLDVLGGMLQRDVTKRWTLDRVRDVVRSLADKAESKELEASGNSPDDSAIGSVGLTPVTQISEPCREVLRAARRASTIEEAVPPPTALPPPLAMTPSGAPSDRPPRRESVLEGSGNAGVDKK
jgi:serine/threonine protein kinase